MCRNWLGGSRDMYLARSRDGVNFSRPGEIGQGHVAAQCLPHGRRRPGDFWRNHFTAWRRGEDVFLASPGGKRSGSVRGRMSRWQRVETALMWPGPMASPSNCGMAARSKFSPRSEHFLRWSASRTVGALAAWEEDGGIQIRHLQ